MQQIQRHPVYSTMKIITLILLLFSLVSAVSSKPIPSAPSSSDSALAPDPHRSLPRITVLPHHPEAELVKQGDSQSKVLNIYVIGPSPEHKDVKEYILRMMSYVSSKEVTVHVHIIVIPGDTFDMKIGYAALNDALSIVETLCNSKDGLKHIRVLALPTELTVDKKSSAYLERLEACGVIIVARARPGVRRGGSGFRFSSSTLLVAPPGQGEEGEVYNSALPLDLWVHTSPGNWGDAVLRATGVTAQYSCDPSKAPVKDSVMKLGQRKPYADRGKNNFLVLEPLIDAPPYMVPVKWDIKQPSQPWITVSYIDRKFFPQGQDFPNDLNHMAPYRPPHTPNFSHLSLPGIADVAPGQSNSVTRDANKDLEGDGQHGRPKTP